MDDLLTRALDPDDDDVRLIASPGQRPGEPILPGDLVIAREPGMSQRTSVVVQAPSSGVAVVDPWLPFVAGTLVGRPRGRRTARIGRGDGLMRSGRTVVRMREGLDEAVATRPVLRQGSRGPAVSEAQSLLNGAHGRRVAQGGAGLDRCPLAVDGIFGRNTRAATVAFQRIAFPADPREWDGVIGPKTWGALVADDENRVLPALGALDPARWEAILRPHATGRVSLRTGNAVRALIDGVDAFRAMADDMAATRGARDYIYLLGWDNFDDFALGPAGDFRAIYTAAAGRDVEVAVMLWDQFVVRTNDQVVARLNRVLGCKAILDDLTANNTPASRARLAAALAAARVNPLLIPVILDLIEPDLARLFGSHHQKLLVVKRGETLIGYCGGLDMNPDRVRVVRGNKGQPHHDTHCRVVGPSAHDLLSTFISRWRHHPGSARFGALRGESEPVPSPIARPSATDAPFGGPASVLVARTFNPVRTSPPLVVRERSIKPILLDAIGQARRFIYCEDQYLVDLDTADALAAAIPRLAHVTILIPGNPITDMPFAKEYRRDFAERILSRLSTADRAKLGIFQLTVPGTTPPPFGDHTYVHSKSWVFDDELAVIGTANCNRRSYTFDSEVDALVFDTSRAERAASRLTWAQQYRMALWAHHLGVPGATLSDGALGGALWRRSRRPTSARIADFDHRLPTGLSRAGLEQRVMNIASEHLRDLVDPVP